MSKTRVPAPGRGWAYTGTIIGGLVSVAANVAHSFIPPHDAPADWAPRPGAIGFAMVWPVFLFIIIEAQARVTWPKGKGWWLLRWIGSPPVAGVAAFVSYKHLSGLLAYYGEEPLVVSFGPLAVDGLMLTCTAALLAINHNSRVAATLSANAPVSATSAAEPIAWPMVHTPTVGGTWPGDPAPVAPAPVVPVALEPVAAPVTPPVIPPSVVPSASRESVTTSATKPPAVALAPSTTNISVTASDAAQPHPPVPAAMLTRATHIARAHLTTNGTPITAGELAVRLRTDSKVAARLLAALDLPDNTDKPAAALNGSPVKVTR